MENYDHQYEFVLDILPDADPTYVRKMVTELCGEHNAISTFILENLSLDKYPKLIERRTNEETAVGISMKFANTFDIENFLKNIPDPFKHFMERPRNGKECFSMGISYLKMRYRSVRITDIGKCYRSNNYNLTRTCQDLDCWTIGIKPMSVVTPKQIELSLSLLQEVQFIEYKREIKEFLAARTRMNKEAQQWIPLQECGCCFDEYKSNDMAECEGGHVFCKSCIKKGAEIQIGYGKTELPCLTDCKSTFSLNVLQTVLMPVVFSKLLIRKQNTEVLAAGIPGLETCPFCHYACIPVQEDKVFHCLNPECMKDSCRTCYRPSHLPLCCEEIEDEVDIKARTYIEDKLTAAIVRTCTACGNKFIKVEGCNRMKCTCGNIMCYNCQKPIDGYKHFKDETDNEGTSKACPLWSKKEDTDVIEKEAAKAKAEALIQYPNAQLKHDPTKIWHILKASNLPK